MSTVQFAFPYIAADQARKHVTHNSALDMIDAILGGLVASATTTTAPGSPAEGEAYLVPAGATGFGDAAEDDIAVYTGGEWIASPPFFGRRVFALDAGTPYVYAGSWGWRLGSIAGSVTGDSAGLVIREATLSGRSGASATAAGLIPSRSIVLGVLSKTTVAITGPTSYTVGDAGDASRYGSTLGIALGSSNLGVVGPFAVYADTDVTVTAAGGSFSAGTVALAALLIRPALAV
jgi:uncharacterized protein DUF2793